MIHVNYRVTSQPKELNIEQVTQITIEGKRSITVLVSEEDKIEHDFREMQKTLSTLYSIYPVRYLEEISN